MKALFASFAYNEGTKIRDTLARVPGDREYDFLVMDDGSSDGSLDDLDAGKFILLRNDANRGIGASIRRVIGYAREHGYEVLGIMAGNNKDEPEEIPKLLAPIANDEADVVQGSRYLPGGVAGNTPAHRRFATRWVHPVLFSVFARQRMTDTTNGFRAIRLSIFDDQRIDLDQPWLEKYELEPYILFKAIRLGYRVAEVPVSKIYPPKELGYTKMRPVTGWWSILRPIFLLGLGFKK